jgi:AcrR family transcriptional regulator
MGFDVADAAERRQMIESVASRLFAALGYDGVSISEVAAASGVDVAEINRLCGGKRELYLLILSTTKNRS